MILFYFLIISPLSRACNIYMLFFYPSSSLLISYLKLNNFSCWNFCSHPLVGWSSLFSCLAQRLKDTIFLEVLHVYNYFYMAMIFKRQLGWIQNPWFTDSLSFWKCCWLLDLHVVFLEFQEIFSLFYYY